MICDEPQRVAILGCTGSIGTQTLDVCRRNADRIQVVALSAHGRTEELVAAAREFKVAAVAVSDTEHADDPVLSELPAGCEVGFGSRAVSALAEREDVDTVLVSIVGVAGLEASLRAVEAGKRLALANKESLVVGGDLLMPRAAADQILPVDSEHSAILQCRLGEPARDVHAIWLTCSGGPFFGRSRASLDSVSVGEALSHPTWSMGAKISIDSATLMNKGLERIEAHHLFGVPYDAIVVLIQRQSKIHSMVEYADGSVIAHLGASDMRIPIQYALSYPARWETPAPRLDFRTIGSLDFAAPDLDAFRCLELADQAGRIAGTMPCVLNAANEVAVAAFLAGRCAFADIDRVVESCMASHDASPVESFDQLIDIDDETRHRAEDLLRRLRAS
ncbi:1-deoxy-D-xylulose 5-phosphate reductoisomerase [Coriobacterium glomerans PW2]|uniref:1-deoxy-D-xylulose 5-phosphate reductoisomerase n=1 Tax=Coriobacterium glomerans (strain ATCC 49209 / DSM 20642 / JCM 10262 / PW2) TaxID=700015 RepID=F2N9H4_CORGP|nr:1-deoxy-D-xylulose-5-phosphate reductoisomerase [Coriobacterium glomerans]AEB07003.1 1-deoxy-D-xylulose 5-phosphate reductoisomerase [Coriobacterium glomerans PW2]